MAKNMRTVNESSQISFGCCVVDGCMGCDDDDDALPLITSSCCSFPSSFCSATATCTCTFSITFSCFSSISSFDIDSTLCPLFVRFSSFSSLLCALSLIVVVADEPLLSVLSAHSSSSSSFSTFVHLNGISLILASRFGQ